MGDISQVWHRALTSGLEKLRIGNTLCDTIIATSDGESLHSHACVLAAASPVLQVNQLPNLLLLIVSSSLYVSHMFVTTVLSNLCFQSCPLELVSPLQVTHLPPVWDLLLPLA